MAIKGKQIDNVHSGQTIIFHETAADTEGQFLLMESVYRAGSLKPAAHYHPIQTNLKFWKER